MNDMDRLLSTLFVILAVLSFGIAAATYKKALSFPRTSAERAAVLSEAIFWALTAIVFRLAALYRVF